MFAYKYYVTLRMSANKVFFLRKLHIIYEGMKQSLDKYIKTIKCTHPLSSSQGSDGPDGGREGGGGVGS